MIVSGFARPSRVDEIPGCPLRAGAAGDEAACAACPYNALKPGASRVGCTLSTGAETYRRALEQLGQLDPAAKERLLGVLSAERDTANEVGLPGEALAEVARIAERWWPLVANDAGVQQVVAGMLQFARAGLLTGEPVRILA
jgi:hypothetical protein